MKRRTVAAALVVVALGAAVPAALASDAPRSDAPRSDAPPLRRLLVLSMPHLTWADLERADAPNLDALVAESSIADLAVRVKRRKTQSDTGYLTIGAGTRAVAPSSSGVALGPDEPFEGGPAGEAYDRRMGIEPDASVLVLSLPDAVERNEDEHFGAELGALGEALAEAGIHRAVVTNADRTLDRIQSSDYSRAAAFSLMDEEGTVEGRVDRGMLRADPAAPFGIRLDADDVAAAFEREWRDRTVVLVEFSDLDRTEAYRRFVRPSERDPMTIRAIEAADRLAGGLLEHVDPARDGVLLVAPASPRGKPRLTVAALRAPGVEPSLMRSATTRRDGFVTIYDVGAGIASLMGVERPESMEGRPLEAGRRDGDAASRRAHLVDEDSEAVFRDDAVGWFTALFVALQLALAFVAVQALRIGRGRRPVAWAALALLAVLPMTYLAGLVDFHDVGIAGYVAFVFGGAAAIASAAWFLGRGDPVVSVAWVLAVVVGVIVGNVVFTNSVLQFSTVFGDSPIVAGRFTGINNLTFAQLAAGGIILAVLVAHRLGGRRGAAAAAALLAMLLVIDGLPAWGADVGGVLTAVPAFAFVASRLWGAPIRVRTLVLFAVVTLVVIGAFVAYDLAQPSEQRSHLGRLVEQIDAQGSDAFVTVVTRKLFANLRVITSSVWLLMVPGALAFAAYLVWRRPTVVRVIDDRIPTFAVALGGLFVAGVLGFALNDSGIAVPGMVLGVLNPAMVHLAARMHERTERVAERPPVPVGAGVGT